MWQSVEISNYFNILTLKQIFWKKKTFLVESAKTENESSPYKTALSEASVKTNRMVSTKWTYHKEPSFAIDHFIFFKIFFQFKNLF